jgi:hypothetical protein
MGDDVLTGPARIASKGIILAAALILLAACQQELKMSQPLPPGVPDNAVHVRDDLYMIPIKHDNTGCMMYRAYSTKGAAVAAIFYRTAGGGFVMDKSKSACD